MGIHCHGYPAFVVILQYFKKCSHLHYNTLPMTTKLVKVVTHHEGFYA